MEQVRLPELETIRRFSIAVRSEHAPVEQVIEALRMDLERVEGALKGRRTAAPARKPGGAVRSTKSTRR
ncbi:MAG: hypothetical protein ACRDKG_09010 [Actinomycetota bacterium]